MLRKITSGFLFLTVSLLLMAASPFTLRDPAFVASLTPAEGGAAYTYHAVRYDTATPNRLERATSWTGVTDGKTGTISFWVKFTNDGSLELIFANPGGDFELTRTTGNLIQLMVFGGITLHGTTQLTAASGWHHVLIAWDLTTSASCKLYVDNVDETTITSGPNDITADYTLTNWQMPTDTGDDFRICEFICKFNTLVDITQSSNRLKFRTAGGKPENPGSDASTALGVAAHVYMPNAFGTVEVNAGTGGNWTKNGTPADSDSDKP